MKNNKIYIDAISLMERMEKHMTNEEVNSLKNDIAQSIERIHSDDIFDVDKTPIKTLDASWERYHPYTLAIDHRNPLASRTLAEGTNYREQIENVKSVILQTFPIPPEHFVIKEGNHGLFAAILVALTDDNVEVIEKAMETKRFFRSQPTDSKLLIDRKNRKWIDLRFEPMDPDDVTEEVHRKYNFLYHLAPSKFAQSIRKNGLKVSNNNPNYKYSEERVYFMEGEIQESDVKELVNTLYTQAKDKNIEGLTVSYVLFTFDLAKLDSSFRFFYDINEPKGIYTKTNVPPSVIIREEEIFAETTDRF